MVSPTQYNGKDGSSIIVRLAMPEDYDASIATFQKVASERIYLNTEETPPDIKDIWTRRWLRNGDTNMFAVSEVMGKIVGGIVLNLYSNSPKTSHVRELGMWILKEYRGKGVGNAMMEYAIKWVEDSGSIKKVTLGVWSTNLSAISLYLKFGFHIEGSYRDIALVQGEYVDEILMARDFPELKDDS